jgi:hypothetical protein
MESERQKTTHPLWLLLLSPPYNNSAVFIILVSDVHTNHLDRSHSPPWNFVFFKFGKPVSIWVKTLHENRTSRALTQLRTRLRKSSRVCLGIRDWVPPNPTPPWPQWLRWHSWDWRLACRTCAPSSLGQNEVCMWWAVLCRAQHSVTRPWSWTALSTG